MTTSARRSAPHVEPKARTMASRFRLLPLVMVVSVSLLGLKVFHLGAGLGEVLGPALAGSVIDQAALDNVDAERLAAIAPAAGDGAAQPDASKAAAPDAGATQGDASSDGGKAANADKDKDANADVQPAFMSRSEINLLQDLSNRRQQLDARSQQLDTRERLLMATEKRIDKKIERLKSISAEIKAAVHTHSAEEEAQLKSLVKVYEAMKPADAARIFDKLDMDILISVVERMKERSVAPVLAKMDPDAAKALTVELATKKKLPTIDGSS